MRDVIYNCYTKYYRLFQIVPFFTIHQQVFVFFVDVEAMACCGAINFAAEIGIHEVIIEGDAQIVIV